MVRICLIVAILVGLSHGAQAAAESRIALVIGNSAYQAISPLRNPRNDATLMSDTLAAVGFDVITAFDGTRRDMARAVRDFGAALRGAGPGAVGLFFYAGHGVQHEGHNYLLPVGTSIDTASDLTIEAIKVSDVLAKMAEAGNALNLVILDACRNNPFPNDTRSTTRGLARVSAFNGAMVAFSAGPGEVAFDGEGTNSPYTRALAQAISTPGLSVEQVFKQARVDVRDATDGRQTPWEESSLTGDFYFLQGDAAGVGSATGGDANVEAVFWDSVRNSDTVGPFEAYLRQFPDGIFASLARARIDALTSRVAVGIFPQAGDRAPDGPCEGGIVTRVAGAPACLRVGDEFRDCDLCPVMVVVPAGRFMRGAPEDTPDRSPWSKVRHEVTIDTPFAIGKFEVTFDQWDTCVRDTGCTNPLLDDLGWGRGRRPAILVPWTDAHDYGDWLTAGTGAAYRLPSEAEWEYAARAGQGDEQIRAFNANPALICDHGNIADARSSENKRTDACDDGVGDETAEVGTYQPNAFGLHDMIGNVFEWVEDCTAYYGADLVDARPRTSDCKSPDFRMRRGGAYTTAPAQSHSFSRYFGYFDYGDRATGFRIVRTLDPVQ